MKPLSNAWVKGALMLPALALLTFTGHPAMAGAATAEAFAAGGTFCFDIGSGKSGENEQIKLVTRAGDPAPELGVIEIHGVERGTWQGGVFINALVGSGTIGPSSVPGSKETVLHISLLGNGNGYKLQNPNEAELWSVRYALELSRDTMTGKLFGYAVESNAIVDGALHTAEASIGVLRDVKPMDCAAF